MINSRLSLFLLCMSIMIIAVLTTACTQKYEVKLNVEPENAGEVSGEGVYVKGTDIAVKAEPHEGYQFVRWEEEGEQLTTSWNYPFIVRKDRVLTAKFEKVEE
ncbi:hypothetical protein LGQ02_10210 [Bacillus shivajii]|uniref:InlB B-repeat-containing protein n=1 Tax=Bacillus shivajii TaxID=1983719 RepID=UPI001CF9715D|nr:hypothetical protein [Bacillus shivajii]UCZ55065.1 hypothetical protein LGQ02_10210 [Bacillus shivajii]